MTKALVKTPKQATGNLRVNVSRKMEYTNMKKDDVPYGHYFKWVAFHSKLMQQNKKQQKQGKSRG